MNIQPVGLEGFMKYIGKKSLGLSVLLIHLNTHGAVINELTLAVKLAQQNDPWLQKSQLHEVANVHNSVAAQQLPDPTISMGLMNLPTDGWQFNQEPMTQLNVGISQRFERGDTLSLRAKQLAIQSEKEPIMREIRRRQVKTLISELWLEGFRAQQTIRLIDKDKTLFEQMVDITEANYASVTGKTSQQDVIRAQLALTKLDDKRLVQQQILEEILAQLQPWLTVQNSNDFGPQGAQNSVDFGNALPVIAIDIENFIDIKSMKNNELYSALRNHPEIILQQKKQAVASQDVAIAKEQFKPQWGVSASYGYRDDDPSGNSRADFFTVGVNVAMPIFSTTKQDKMLAATKAKQQSIVTEKTIVLRELIGKTQKQLKALHRLEQRYQLYHSQIIEQTAQQAEAALTAYTHDNGSFSDVVSARISQLDTKLSTLNISVEALKTVARLNYYLADSSHKQSLAGETNE